MYYTHENCFRATWTIWGHAEPSSGPRGPSEDLWDPLEGHLGPKRALLGSLGAQKRPDTRPKCVVTIISTQSDELAAVGTEFGPSGPLSSFSPSYGLLEAKWALLGPRGYPNGPRVAQYDI